MPGSAGMYIVRGYRAREDQVAETQASTAEFAAEAVQAADAAERQRRALENAQANVTIADDFIQRRASYEQRLGVFADARAALVLGSLLGAVGGPVGALVGIGIAAWMPRSPSVSTLQGWGPR